MRPLFREAVTERIEAIEPLDRPAGPLQEVAKRLFPDGSLRKDLVSGTWLGHPVHPPLTDVAVGCWTASFLLDALPGHRTDAASDRLIGLGIAAAVPTAVTGLADWSELFGGPRRVGVVHATGNTTALSLFTLSYLARSRGRRGLGRLLSVAAFGAATFSAYLGGHLSFGRGVGVNQTAFQDPPGEWTPVLDAEELPDGRLTPASAEGNGIVLWKHGGSVHAIADRCSHRGCSLHEGELHDGTVTCPCHGSTFKLEDGSVVHGPATSPQPAYEVRVREGKVEVRGMGQ